MPKSGWQPVPQWAVLDPQKPNSLQHAPSTQVYAWSPPQEPSGLTPPVGAGTAPEVSEAIPQTPNRLWQPVPQWALLEPQKPNSLQHEPGMQVYPGAPPQVPSGLTPPVGWGAAVVVADWGAALTMTPQTPNSGWQPAAQ